MASVSQMSDVTVVSAARLTDVIVRTLTQEGATPGDAQEQATMLVEADLRDQHSHGVQRLPVLVGRLRNDLIRSGLAPEMNWAKPSAVQVDGKRGFGPVVAHAAIEEIVPHASSNGIAIAAVRNSNHLGILAPYVEAIAARGQIGLAFTTSEALVHPWNGNRPLVGTNPIGIGIPTSGEPLVLDMSTAEVSMGKVLSHVASGIPIPHGWAVDQNGDSTTDAAAAVEGALSPFGGPKGYALGVALEAMIGVLTSTALGTDVKGTLDTESVATKGEIFLAITPQALGSDAPASALDDYFTTLRASGTDEAPVLIPGDRSRRVRAQRLADGIPLPSAAWDMALNLLDEEAR